MIALILASLDEYTFGPSTTPAAPNQEPLHQKAKPNPALQLPTAKAASDKI